MLIIEPIKRHIEANKSTIFTLLITSPLYDNYNIKSIKQQVKLVSVVRNHLDGDFSDIAP